MRSHQQQAIERLAREAQVPVHEVAQLYQEARAELEAGARIKAFLGIFAMRKVRRLLRQGGARRSTRSPARSAEAAARTPA